MNEFSDQVIDRYLIITGDGQYAGSVEFKPYEPQVSGIDQVAPFYSHPLIAENAASVAEVDKVALLPEYRGKLIAELLSSIVDFARKMQIKYLVSLLEPVFYRALRITFHVPMYKVAERTFYKGDDVIPVIFDMQKMYNHPEQYSWLILREELVME